MNWISVRFIMIVAQVLELDTQAIDFVLVFVQVNLEVPVYMELPAGMDLTGHGKDSSKYLLKLKQSLYGLKQASMNWHCKLKLLLKIEVSWSPYQNHMYLFQRK